MLFAPMLSAHDELLNSVDSIEYYKSKPARFCKIMGSDQYMHSKILIYEKEFEIDVQLWTKSVTTTADNAQQLKIHKFSTFFLTKKIGQNENMNNTFLAILILEKKKSKKLC